MTLLEAVEQQCWKCGHKLVWSGFAGYEHSATCCSFVYTLKPRVFEYDLEVSKEPDFYEQKPLTTEEIERLKKESGVIPGKDGGLFHHPV